MLFILVLEPVPINLCNPSPCGPNAKCENGACFCHPEYHGDPYIECRPECIVSTDCLRDKACIRNKCKDPCPGTCGQNALCDVINHIPMCKCPPSFSGNAFIECRPIQGTTHLLFSSFILVLNFDSYNLIN